VLAGAVTPERASLNRERNIEVPEPGSEPESSAMALVWDHEKAADIPAQQTVVRGSVLNFKAKAHVLHPINLQVVSLPDYQFNTDVLVLDVRGGQPLPTTIPPAEREELNLNGPGEMLVVTADGQLVMRNELDDLIDYRDNHFKDPEKPNTQPGDPAAPGGYPGAGGYVDGATGGYPGYPGGSAGRRGRGRNKAGAGGEGETGGH
jgi:hypothetical protein